MYCIPYKGSELLISNIKILHKDLRHSNVERYEFAPKRHVDIKGSGRLYDSYMIYGTCTVQVVLMKVF